MTDLAIIGGGPGGYVAAERAGAKGLSVVLFEKRELGGVCLNEGCIPTKTLLYSAKVYDYARHGDKYGVHAEGVGYDFGQIIARKNKVVKKLVAGVGAKMKAHKVEVVKGEAYVKGRSAEGIEIIANGVSYRAANLLLCTGSEAFVPPIPGIKEAGDVILTNREILALTEQPKSLIIIGGGVIGMEFASFYNSIGTEVVVIEMLPEILGGLDSEISAMLRDIYAKKGIKFNLSCKVTEVRGNEVVYTTPDGKTETVKGDKILVSVGRRAVTAGLGLENIGVELVRGAVKVDNQMRTNVPNVFAAGDITGFSMLAHTASREGEVVVNNLVSIKNGRKPTDTMRYNAIPGVVYTNPEVAGVGLTEEQAKKEGIAYRIAKLPMAYAGRFVAENEGGTGLCKVLIGEKYGEVLGVHLLGNPCSEMIYGACIAIEQEMTLKELEEVVFPHPTVSEIFKETVFAF
ncbi:MAG: dihydrolipoyl dehydrogenase [Tannerella sp.]|jgi:dihydrolipoamide dehydrogenase|nr:dihydrolipoyl dehydrogenase [Tannerella sp.]